jgi:hypothetical protein
MYFLFVYHTIKGNKTAENTINTKEKNNHSKIKDKSLIVNKIETKNKVVIDKEIIQNKGCKIMKAASSLTFLCLVLGKIRLRKAMYTEDLMELNITTTKIVERIIERVIPIPK